MLFRSSRLTEIVLAKSEAGGRPVRFAVPRGSLGRAVELGFTEFHVTSADDPILCTDATRKLLFMPLGKDEALPPANDALRIVSTEPSKASAARETAGSKPKVTEPAPADSDSENDNGAVVLKLSHSRPPKAASGSFNVLIEEAAAVKAALREAYCRSSELLIALKKHRKQGQAVRATLATLRQLQQVAE